MKTRAPLILAATALSLAALAGCSGNSPTPAANGPAASSAPAASSGNDLATGSSTLGTVVIDGKGMTVYYYSKDVKGSGASACSGGCAALWPAVAAGSNPPKVDGVTGTVGTITRDDGTVQLTIDGMPVYHYAQDAMAGDVNGEGVDNLWYAVNPDGTVLKSGGGTKSNY